MWKVVMIYPELTTGVRLRSKEEVFAAGLVHNAEIEVDKDPNLREAKVKALNLALRTLREQKFKSQVIGFGVRSTLAKKKSGPLHWQLLLPQLVERIKAWKEYEKSLRE